MCADMLLNHLKQFSSAKLYIYTDNIVVTIFIFEVYILCKRIIYFQLPTLRQISI